MADTWIPIWYVLLRLHFSFPFYHKTFVCKFSSKSSTLLIFIFRVKGWNQISTLDSSYVIISYRVADSVINNATAIKQDAARVVSIGIFTIYPSPLYMARSWTCTFQLRISLKWWQMWQTLPLPTTRTWFICWLVRRYRSDGGILIDYMHFSNAHAIQEFRVKK